jgi:energy-coupling factor transporter ATP-binding protein EcfA2
VWGVNGTGKSTLIKSLYGKIKHETPDQFDGYRWVDISHPLDLSNLCGSLLGNSHSTSDIIQSCRQLLQQHQWLIVIDDIQANEEWDMIRDGLLSDSSKGVIIVITTEASIARYCCAGNDKFVFSFTSLGANAEITTVDEEVCFRTKFLFRGSMFICYGMHGFYLPLLTDQMRSKKGIHPDTIKLVLSIFRLTSLKTAFLKLF